MSDHKVVALFYVQSCRGVGHLHRIASLATTLISTHPTSRVIVVSGGPSHPDVEERLVSHGIRFVQLETLKAANKEQWKLVTNENTPITTDIQIKRRDVLLNVLRMEVPTAVVIEMFPFGRRRFHFEIEPLLNACYEQRPRPLIACSVRDLLVKLKINDQLWALNKINTYYDCVFVHSDSNIIPFSHSFKYSNEMKDKIVYTGYVVDSSRVNAIDNITTNNKSNSNTSQSSLITQRKNQIIVSTGNSYSGHVEHFYHSVLLARLKLIRSMKDTKWILRINKDRWSESIQWRKNFNEKYRTSSSSASSSNITDNVRWEINNDRDFINVLNESFLSISQGGYNTTMETIITNTPNIIIPISVGKRGKDIEQLNRSNIFCQKNLVDNVYSEDDLVLLHDEEENDENSTFQQFRKNIFRIYRQYIQSQPPPPLQKKSKLINVNGSKTFANMIVSRSKKQFSKHVHNSIPLPISVASVGFSPPTLLRPSFSPSSSSTTTTTTTTTLPTAPPLPTIPTVTVLLLNYKRPENIRRILTDLMKQKPIPPDIFLWNNSGEQFIDSRVTWQIDSSINKYCWPRWMMASLARTKYICE